MYVCISSRKRGERQGDGAEGNTVVPQFMSACLQTKAFDKILVLFANSLIGDEHDCGRLSCTIRTQ